MRFMHREAMGLDEQRIIFRAAYSRTFTLSLLLVGAAALVSRSFWHIGPRTVPLLVSFVWMPACLAMLCGAVLYCYEQRTVIDAARGTVRSREMIVRLPLRTLEWRIEEFDSVRVTVNVAGSESRPDRYYTVTLWGPGHNVPLFDREDYQEARKEAGQLAAGLGLKAQ